MLDCTIDNSMKSGRKIIRRQWIVFIQQANGIADEIRKDIHAGDFILNILIFSDAKSPPFYRSSMRKLDSMLAHP